MLVEFIIIKAGSKRVVEKHDKDRCAPALIGTNARPMARPITPWLQEAGYAAGMEMRMVPPT